MELAFRHEELGFQAEVRSFIDQNWPEDVRGGRGVGDDRRARSSNEQAWYAALVKRGWSVPGWPAEHGGTGWTAAQKFIWARECARAEVPQMSDFGVTRLGPALCRWGNRAQQARFLPPIRQARVRWWQGHSDSQLESAAAGLLPPPGPSRWPAAVRQGDDYVVNGEMGWAGGMRGVDWRGDWMFALVDTRADGEPSARVSLVLVDLQSRGIELRRVATNGDRHGATRVSLTDVRVPGGQLIGDVGRGVTYARAMLDHDRVGPAPMAAARVRLQRAGLIAAQTPVDGRSVAEDDAFLRKYRELEVDLLGLEVLELRILADLADIESGRAPRSASTDLGRMLEFKGADIARRIADLTVETLGYYALPYPDELLIDNEGAIGHDYALDAVHRWLSG